VIKGKVRRGGWKPIPLVLLGTVLALTILVAAWWVWGLHRDERLRKIWRQEIFDGLEPGERFPAHQRNETALALEGLAAEIGLDFSVGDRTAAAPSDKAAHGWERAYQLVPEHQWELRASTIDRTPDLNPELAAFVEENAESLARLRDLLLSRDPPRWEFDIALGADAPLPNLITHLQAHRLLLLAAHQALGERDEAAAVAFLEAAWRLGREPAENPILIAQLIRLLELGEELLVVRRLCSLDASWRQRLDSLDLRARALRGLRLEGWVLHSARLPLGDDRFLSSTYQRLMFLPLGEAVHRSAERLRTEDPLTLDFEAVTREETERIPRWAGFSRIFFPQVLNFWPKTIRAELVVEHSLRVLDARRRLASGRATGPARQGSAAVPGLFWLDEPTASGVRIVLDGELDDQEDHPIALDFTIDRATCLGESRPADPLGPPH
jgi:hypothetical protein